MRYLIAMLGGLSLLAQSSPALAEDCEAPCAGYEISTELQNDWVIAADQSLLKSDILQPTNSAGFILAPTDYLKFMASMTTESIVDPVEGKSAFFQGIGSYAEELYAILDVDPAVVRVGKFNTVFSLVSEVDPGINATDLVSNIDADERWGAEAVLGFEALGINQNLAATLFTTDRTFLSGSLFASRGKTRLSDGGAGNTEGISSVSIAINGCKGAEAINCYEHGILGYRLGFRLQRAGHASAAQTQDGIKPNNETAIMAAATARFDVEDLTVRLVSESDYIRHFQGNPYDMLILTGSAAFEYGPMTYTASYSRQKNYVPGDVDTVERHLEISGVYQPKDGVPFDGGSWSLGVAYDYGRDAEGQDTHALSLLFTFTLGGTTDLGD